MPTYAIVHSTVSCMLRRVIADDEGAMSVGPTPEGTRAVICTHEGWPDAYHQLLPGESVILVTTSGDDAHGPADWKEVIQGSTGVIPPDLVCAIVDQDNRVIDVIHADPAVDAPPTGDAMILCYSPQIGIGCTYDPVSGLFSSMEGKVIEP